MSYMMTERNSIHNEDEQRNGIFGSIVAHLLVVIFGMSAWIGVNGIYVQLPLLILSAPEGWNLASYIVIIIQAANIGPVTYTVARKYCSSLNESHCIFVLLAIGTLGMAFLAFFYEKTYVINSNRYSLAMFICTFFIALVDCTSSVLFMPYMRNSNEKYLVSYFIGEGLSGVLPSLVAFLQGVGGNPECKHLQNGTTVEIRSDPRFPPKDYFIFLLTVFLVSLCSFGYLQYFSSFRSRRPTGINDCKMEGEPQCEEIAHQADSDNNNDRPCSVNIKFQTIYLHYLIAIVCFLSNGFLPSLQTYSCLPYGNVAFHLTVTLANIANPVACFLFFWLNFVRFSTINVLFSIGIISSGYVIYLAAMSPSPPLRGTETGVAMVVFIWVLLTGVISYLKLSITSKIRKNLGSKSLISVGIIMQLGSACGAIFSFALTNYTPFFQAHKPCAPL